MAFMLDIVKKWLKRIKAIRSKEIMENWAVVRHF